VGLAVRDSNRAALLKENAQHLCAHAQGEIRAPQCRMQVAPGSRLAPTALRCDLVDADALTSWTIEILIRKPEGTAALDKALAQRVHVRGDIADVDGRTRSLACARRVSALLEALKVRQHIGKTPAGIT